MPMRVIAGEARGRTLKGPPSTAVRPTSDRVREALFEILESHGVDLENVLDLYSGTGAMGIEALSRGAGHCDFVEADARTSAVIRENLARTGTLARARVFSLPVAKALSRLTDPYGLVVADPPYEYDRAEKELISLIERGLLAPDGVLAIEHSKRKEWPPVLAGREQLLTRRYGDSAITLYS
jgi:16S rRNA (guanine(966)-N(2))-methyltransferase RsmD